MGKGSRPRSVNKDIFDRNYNRIFGGDRMLLAVTAENCTPSAEVREISYRDEAAGDEYIVEGEREELKDECEAMLRKKDPRPGGSSLAYDHKKAHNILNYIK